MQKPVHFCGAHGRQANRKSSAEERRKGFVKRVYSEGMGISKALVGGALALGWRQPQLWAVSQTHCPTQYSGPWPGIATTEHRLETHDARGMVMMRKTPWCATHAGAHTARESLGEAAWASALPFLLHRIATQAMMTMIIITTAAATTPMITAVFPEKKPPPSLGPGGASGWSAEFRAWA